MAGMIDAGYDGALARVTSKDSFVRSARAADLILVSEAEIEAALLRLVGDRRHPGSPRPAPGSGLGGPKTGSLSPLRRAAPWKPHGCRLCGRVVVETGMGRGWVGGRDGVSRRRR